MDSDKLIDIAEFPDEIGPSQAIEDVSVQAQLGQFFAACHAFLGASVAGVVWQQEEGELIHRCSRPSIAQPSTDDPIFSAMLAQQETFVMSNVRKMDDMQDSVLLNRALPIRTLVARPFDLEGVEGHGSVYVGTLVEVQLSERWVNRLDLLSSWARFIFAVYFLSESQERLTKALNVTRVQAHTDDLTRIWNRKGILQLLDRELNRAQRESLFVSVLFVDIDNLKPINDGYGHAAGDEAIRATAKTLLAGLRDSDAVGRYGGDEFLVVLVDPEKDRVQLVADRLAQAINHASFRHDGEDIGIGASIGLVVAHSNNPLPADEMISRADHAVYAAKDRGRGRVVRFEELSASEQIRTLKPKG